MAYSSWRTTDGLYTLKDSENKQIVLPYKYIKHTSVKNYNYGKSYYDSGMEYMYYLDKSKDFYMYRQGNMIGFTHFSSTSECKAYADAHPNEYIYYDTTTYGYIDPNDIPYDGNKVYFIPAFGHKDFMRADSIKNMFTTGDSNFSLYDLFSTVLGLGSYPFSYNSTNYQSNGIGETMIVTGCRLLFSGDDANTILLGKRKVDESGSPKYGLFDGNGYYFDRTGATIQPADSKKIVSFNYVKFPYIMLARCSTDSDSSVNDYYMDYIVRYTKDTGVFIGYIIEKDGVLQPWISIVDFYISDGKYKSRFQLINCYRYSSHKLSSITTFVRDCETDTVYQCDILGKINTLYPNWLDSTTKAGDYFNGADCITWNFSGSFDIRKVSSSDPAELIGLFNQRFSGPTLAIKPVNGNIKCMMFKSDLSTNLKACTITNATPLGQSEVTDHFITITERSTTHPRIIYKVKD